MQENVDGRVFKFLNSVVSDVGVKRNENQDAFSIAHSRVASLFVVADGMGGARGGATASALAASVVGLEAFNSSGNITIESLRRVIEQANLAINARSQRDKDLKGMGTTIATIAFVENRVIVASVGDSRVYFLRNDEFKQVTKDHTFVQELVDKGAIKSEEASGHPISHMLTRSLGPVDKVNVDIFEFDRYVQERDRFLICSDGLYNHVAPQEIKEYLSQGTPEDVCQVLLKLAIERGGSDNITIQVIEPISLDNPESVFVGPENGKIELNLLGTVETKPIGSETDLEIDIFKIEDFAKEDETPPAVLNYEFEEPNPKVWYIAGSLFMALIAVFMVLGSNRANISNDKPQEQIASIDISESKEDQTKIEQDAQENQNLEKVEADNDLIEPTIESTKDQEIDNEQIALDTQVSVDRDLVNRVVEQANSTVVEEEAPKIRIPIKQSPPDQPIIWENEDLKFKKLKDSPTPVQKTSELEFKIAKDSQGLLEQKKEIRQRINDLDYKLQLLLPEFKTNQEAKLNKESEDAKVAIDALAKDVSQLEDELLIWDAFKDVYDETSFLEYLGKTADKSESLKRIFLEYKEIDEEYKNSVKMWHENPRDLSRASEMGAKARKRDEYFKSMQDKVKKAVDLEIVKVLEKFSEKIVEKQNSESLLLSLSKKKGFLQASFEIDPARAFEIKQQYISEREQLILKLDRIKDSLPDQKELEIQKNLILNDLKSKL